MVNDLIFCPAFSPLNLSNKWLGVLKALKRLNGAARNEILCNLIPFHRRDKIYF